MGPMATSTQPTPTYDPAAEVVEICRDLIRIDTTNFDHSVRPQDDFFRYVNGGWLKKTTIAGDATGAAITAGAPTRTP